MATKPLTPVQRDLLANVEHLRRYMHKGYRHYRKDTGATVAERTVDALFKADLIRTAGDVGRDMTFALTDAGREALS